MNSPLRIALIGSSTAAGVGAEPIEMAWAYRYCAYLKTLHPGAELINLAVGGLQTFHLLPTGHRPPPARPLPDPERNITAALALRPSAVIVQAPSNDAAALYGVKEQVANFDLIVRAAAEQGVPIWLFGPQPRCFSPEQVCIQQELREAMRARYGAHYIDVWELLAHRDDSLRKDCDSGDGAHLNNHGHAYLFGQILRADLPKVLSRCERQPYYWIRRIPALKEEKGGQRPLGQQVRVLLRLVRWPNLLTIVAAQMAVYLGILYPALERAGAFSVFSGWKIGLLAAATALTAAAGYLLNDYCDCNIDAINRPRRVTIGRHLSHRAALQWYAALVGGAIGIAAMAAAFLSKSWPIGVFALANGLLALYALRLKCTPGLGNLLVAVLCGASVWVPVGVEPVSYWTRSIGWIWAFACFAFLTNLWREQIKNIEDVEGDAACGCQTLAVRYGTAAARRWAFATGLVFLAALGLLLAWSAREGVSGLWLAAGVGLLVIPVGFIEIRLWHAIHRTHFSAASRKVKFLMLVGLLWLYVAHHLAQ